jgi:hypothetical protein
MMIEAGKRTNWRGVGRLWVLVRVLDSRNLWSIQSSAHISNRTYSSSFEIRRIIVLNAGKFIYQPTKS